MKSMPHSALVLERDNVFSCIKVYRNLVYFSMFFYIKKIKFWNAALYDVIDYVRALVPGLVHCEAWISFK
jgi:hypothetical protein